MRFETYTDLWNRNHTSLAFAVTGDDFDLVDFSELVDLPELDVVQHQSPYVVAESVGVQLGRLEGDARLHLRV